MFWHVILEIRLRKQRIHPFPIIYDQGQTRPKTPMPLVHMILVTFLAEAVYPSGIRQRSPQTKPHWAQTV